MTLLQKSFKDNTVLWGSGNHKTSTLFISRMRKKKKKKEKEKEKEKKKKKKKKKKKVIKIKLKEISYPPLPFSKPKMKLFIKIRKHLVTLPTKFRPNRARFIIISGMNNPGISFCCSLGDIIGAIKEDDRGCCFG